MDLGLSGKHVLISGGSRGIGLGIAKAFAEEGCKVAIAARNAQDLAEAKKQIGDACSTYSTDATDAKACADLIAAIKKDFGGLDILITCAGSGVSVPPGEETAEEWQRVLAVNLLSATNMIAASTSLLAHSSPAGIICISSICGREALGAPVTYSAAKAALDATVNGLSRPLAKKGIRINAISPGNIYFSGGIWDKKMQQNSDAVHKMLEKEVPLGCLGKLEDIAAAAVFLASPRAAFITGANLVVDGGQTRS